MKLKLLFIVAFFLTTSNIKAQTAAWQWAKETVRWSGFPTCKIDNNGNLYQYGGVYADTVTSGDSTIIISPYTANPFLAKYDRYGNVIWSEVQNPPSHYWSSITAMNIDASNNIYIAGWFYDSLSIGGQSFSNPGVGNLFLAELDTSGHIIFLKIIGEHCEGGISNINRDAQGNIYLGASFIDSIRIGSHLFTHYGEIGTGEFLIVKCSPMGDVIWVKNMVGYGGITEAMATDVNGNSYMTGTFAGYSLTIGDTTLYHPNYDTSYTTYTIFIAKYDSAGNAKWAKAGGDAITGEGNDIKTDSKGNVYITGSFEGTDMVFNDTAFKGNGSCANTYIIKFDSSGTILWGKSNVNYYNNNGDAMSIDEKNDIYIIGDYVHSITFGYINLTSVGDEDIFVVKYDSSGNVICAISAGGAGPDFPTAICTDQNGDAYVGGYSYSSSLTFGNYVVPNDKSQVYFMAELSTPPMATSVSDLSISNKNIIAYPNPFITATTIKVDPNIYSNDLIFTLFDLLGEQIMETKISAPQFELQRGDLQSGIYFYKISTENNSIASGKLILID